MWEYSHEGKQLENKWVFRRLQKTGKVCADVMSGGRLFQSRLPATAKARSLTVTSLVVGMMTSSDDDEHVQSVTRRAFCFMQAGKLSG